ncbi:MAG: FAD:protein FMN transferase [Bacteroidales bacterium]|jgi:thiamine biosynthesis lipoprotein|nr:FAD:protein FMN transferase [Bacteroidales bacterium]
MNKIFIFFALIFAVSCTQKQPQFVRFSGEALGTYYVVSYYDENEKNYQSEIDSLLKAFLFVASLHEPESEINAVNENKDIVLSPMFQDIFNKAVSISEISDGAFDLTVGPLVKAYGFWNKEREEITDEKIAEYLKLVDYRGIKLVDGKIVKKNPNMKIDFNAIAKGYAVDIVGQFLEEKGIRTYLIDIGGEVLGKGRKPDGDCWRIGIEKPAETAYSSRDVDTAIDLCNAALATSGNYRKYYEKDGKRYSHTIDPKTGKSVEHSLLSVTVRDSETWRADALATAMMVWGIEKSLQMLEKLPGVEAYFISAGSDGAFVITKSSGF